MASNSDTSVDASVFPVAGCRLFILARPEEWDVWVGVLCMCGLQEVENSATKLVFKACKCDCVQPLLQALHWLLQRHYTTLL